MTFALSDDEVREAYILAADATNADRDNGEDYDAWLAAHDAEVRAEMHIVPCARCGQKPVVANDALNSDVFSLRFLGYDGCPHLGHVFLDSKSITHVTFVGLGGDVGRVIITREAWRDLGESEVLAVSVRPVEQED